MTTGNAAPTDNRPRAIAAIMLALLALSLGDALIKLIRVDLPVWRLFVFRSCIDPAETAHFRRLV